MNFKEVYQFPFIQDPIVSWVYDAKDQFIFQFCDGLRLSHRREYLMKINGESKVNLHTTFRFDKQTEMIFNSKNESVILIRGWGNLTGVGGWNLPAEKAAAIQDSLGDFIVERLNA